MKAKIVISIALLVGVLVHVPAATAQWSASASTHAECFWHVNHWAAHSWGSASADGPNGAPNFYSATVGGTHTSDSDSGVDSASAYDEWVGDVATGTVIRAEAAATATFAGVVQAADSDSEQDICS